MNFIFKNYKCYIVFFITFFFIFGMKTPIGSLAQILTALLCFLGFFFYGKRLLKSSKPFFYIVLFLIYDFVICGLWGVYSGVYDFSILITKTNVILSVVATYILSIFFSDNYNKKDFFVFLSSIFFIQSLIVLAMLLNPAFSDFIMTYTKDSALTERMLDSYSGARGLGLADSAAFGFSVVMALFVLLTFYSYKKNYIGGIYFLLVISLGLIASISAGRVSLLGVFVGLFFWALYLNRTKILRLILLTFVSLVFILSYLISIRNSVIEPAALSVLYNYSMEPIFNYIDYGELRSSSTDILQKMYFPLSEKQLLIGDAKYMDGNAYYMRTDAGYMRFTLFYGAINSIILYFAFAFLLFFVYCKLNSQDEKKLVLLIGVLSFLLHYKGEIILFAVSYNKLLLLVVFYLYLYNSKDDLIKKGGI